MDAQPALQRTFEAIILDRSALGGERAGPRSRIGRLVARGATVVVAGVEPAEVARLGVPAGHGELLLVPRSPRAVYRATPRGPRPVPPAPTDRASGTTAESRTLRLLGDAGITPGLVLVVACPDGLTEGPSSSPALRLGRQLPGSTIVDVRRPACETAPQVPSTGPAGCPDGAPGDTDGGYAGIVAGLLDEQLHRRRTRRLPHVDEDAEWVIVDDDSVPARRRVVDCLFTVSDGRVATRATSEDTTSDTEPLVLAAGVYVGQGESQELLPGPFWPAMRLGSVETRRRRVLDLRAGLMLREDVRDGIILLHRDSTSRSAPLQMVERIAAYATSERRHPLHGRPERLLRAAMDGGFDALLRRHRSAWARRWRDVGVEIVGDPELQLAARFALFQLWGVVHGDGESAIGARGLTGKAYRGHVFWDADVFMLPALATMSPRAARSMLEYRLRRLPQARAIAQIHAFDGARFPWESARDGTDVTPRSASIGGLLMLIRTGELEEHIVADVAWAAEHYAAWTGDHRWLHDRGYPLVVETARYWASRCRRDRDGSVHIDRVMGPDEYHDRVDDNAFTNVMARWNLRRGADLLERIDGSDGARQEAAAWRALAAGMFDG